MSPKFQWDRTLGWICSYAVTFSHGQMLTRDLFGLGNLCYGYYCVLEYDHVHVVVDNARPFMSGTLD